MRRGGRYERIWRNHSHQSQRKLPSGYKVERNWPAGKPMCALHEHMECEGTEWLSRFLTGHTLKSVRLHERSKYILWNYIESLDALQSNVWSCLICLGLTIYTIGSKKFELRVPVYGHYFVSYRKMEKILETEYGSVFSTQ